MSVTIEGKECKVVATIEARMTSSRLPGKVLMPLYGEPALGRLIERLKGCPLLDDIVVATTVNKTDEPIIDYCRQNRIRYFRGSEDDVLGRVLGAAKDAQADLIVEITGDCPLIDPEHVTRIIEIHTEESIDYAANCIKVTFPIGFDVQSFHYKVLEEVDKLTDDPSDREHVSLYIYNHPERYRLWNWQAEGEMYWPECAVTLDTIEDYKLIDNIFCALYHDNPKFSSIDIVRYLRANPGLAKINGEIKRKIVPGQIQPC